MGSKVQNKTVHSQKKPLNVTHIKKTSVCVCVCVCVPVTGPVWPRGLIEIKLYSSMATALEGGEWSAAQPGIKKSTEKKFCQIKSIYMCYS